MKRPRKSKHDPTHLVISYSYDVALQKASIKHPEHTTYKRYISIKKHHNRPRPEENAKPAQLIDELILDHTYKAQLNAIKLNLKDLTDLDFYTDGSLSSAGTPDCVMGIGWLCPSADNINRDCFSAAIPYNPSSTKAETMAILTALLLPPPH